MMASQHAQIKMAAENRKSEEVENGDEFEKKVKYFDKCQLLTVPSFNYQDKTD